MLKVSPAIALNQLLNTGNQDLNQCKVPSDRRKPLLAKIPKKGDHSRDPVRATASLRSQVIQDSNMYSKHTKLRIYKSCVTIVILYGAEM